LMHFIFYYYKCQWILSIAIWWSVLHHTTAASTHGYTVISDCRW
jgi:hypothetical protein